MLRKDRFFTLGWLYFILMFVLAAILPEWVGDENGIIENLQLVWLLAGMYYCLQVHSCSFTNWGGKAKSLWNAGAIYFFLLIMREISWGRTFITMPDGSMIQYSQMGLYGKMVHPLVGILIAVALVLLYQARIWKFLHLVKIPIKSFTLLLLFIFFSWVGERTSFIYFHGQVAEELAEFGAYMMMYVLLRNAGKRATAKTIVTQTVVVHDDIDTQRTPCVRS